MENNRHYQIKSASPYQSENELIYDTRTLQYLLSLLTEEDTQILQDIESATKENLLNYQKTKVPDYSKKRRFYEISWTKLEAQGLIELIEMGNMKMYRVTGNGENAIQLLKEQQ